MKKRLFMLFVPVVVATLVAGCGGGDDPMEPEPPAVEPPPNLTGSYALVSLSSVLSGGLTLTPPLVSGTFSLTQTSVSGDEATGNLSLTLMYPDGAGGTSTIMDEGTFVIRTDGSWEQTGNLQQGRGTYSLAGNVLTVMVTEPPAAVSTTVWQRQ
ncbi:hypothetical protein [Candidatus Palauibacter sp.]|uniref:hypothetical protein n=1 Tax=Candidatus Palauibacter sp. TaxID=3101350 RepID=UPI003AF29839